MAIASPYGTTFEQQRLRRPAATPPSTRPAERPIVAAVEPETARVTAATAARLARELRAPLTFVTVRPRISSLLGERHYQRRLTRSMWRERHAIDAALAEAAQRGVTAHGEIVEGDATSRIVRFAADRHARLLVVGRRARRLRRSVSRRVTAAAGRPVVVAPPPRPENAATSAVGDASRGTRAAQPRRSRRLRLHAAPSPAA